MSMPLARTSARSDLTVQAVAALNRMVVELEGGVYGSTTQVIGDYDQALGVITLDPTDDGELNADLIDNDVDGFTDEEERWGRAITVQRIVAFDPATALPILDTPTIYAFLPDEAQNGLDDDRDGRVDELQLVRIQDTRSVVFLRDVRNEGPIVGNGVAPSPYFRLVSPSYLEISFSMERRVGYDARANRFEMTRLDFRHTLNLRNLNQ